MTLTGEMVIAVLLAVLVLLVAWHVYRQHHPRFTPCFKCERSDIPTRLYRFQWKGSGSRTWYTTYLCVRCASLKKAVPVDEHEVRSEARPL